MGSAVSVRWNDLAVGRYFKIVAYTVYCSPNRYYYYGETAYIYTQYANDQLFRMGTTRADGPYYINC